MLFLYLLNLRFDSSSMSCRLLVSQGCIKPLCDLLICPDPRIVTVCLEGLENILKVGEADKSLGHTDVNQFAQAIDDADGLEKIENLQSHDNTEIYEKAVKILETYWLEEDEEPLPPGDASQSEFHFGGNDHPPVPPGGFNFGWRYALILLHLLVRGTIVKQHVFWLTLVSIFSKCLVTMGQFGIRVPLLEWMVIYSVVTYSSFWNYCQVWASFSFLELHLVHCICDYLYLFLLTIMLKSIHAMQVSMQQGLGLRPVIVGLELCLIKSVLLHEINHLFCYGSK